MSKLSLRDSVLLLTLIPTVLIGLILGGYFTINRYVELEQILKQQGTSIANSLAMTVEQPLDSKDKAKLHSIITKAHNQHASLVNSIAVFDLHNQLIMTSNYHSEFNDLHYRGNVAALHATEAQKLRNNYVIFAPVKYYGTGETWQDAHAKTIAVLMVEISQDQAIIGQQKALLLSGTIILGALFLSVFLSTRLSRMFSTPLSQLQLATDKLIEGKTDIGVSEQMQGEFDMMRQGLVTISEKMVGQRDEMQKHIDQATSDYRETLEQYETQNIQLNIAKKEAQVANRVKSDFLAKMSHELRTPLNGVIGFTRQLYKTPLNKHQKDYLDTIELSANSLLTIISDILDFSKLEAGAMELENIQFQLRDAVNEVMTLLAPSAYEKQLELSIAVNRQVPDNLVGDPTRFKQVLINLISNAIKFTEKGSVKVDISHRLKGDSQTSLLVSVSDTGLGIAQEKQDTLFTPFAQADTSITRKFGGTGLGLIITKHIVEVMQGRITLNSALGNGSCFTFNAIFNLPSRLFNDDLPCRPLENKRVLYFEPQEHTRNAVIAQIESWHMQVTVCDSDEAFFTALEQEFSYDICLVGNMATVDDMQTVKNYINRAREKADYLYLMVNTISHNMRESLIGSGADACISKPLHHRKLCEMLAAPYRLDHPDLSIETSNATHLPLKVLIADDNDANLKLLYTLLEEQVETIETAHNGAQAVGLCKTHKYDLIFMDIQMPIMDGITACKSIKESSMNDDTPIIAVTAHALAGEKEQLVKDGFSGYMTKPIDEDMLKQIICDHSATSPLEREQKEEQMVSSVAPFESHLLDWNLALQRSGNKPHLALEMLNMLLQSVPETIDHLNEASEQEDPEQLLKIVHKFHGACCYTGVPKLKMLAETIETALKQDKGFDFVEPEVLDLIDELSNLNRDAEITASSSL
ncbi:two-component sensor histidine kinase BarA [Pseudoalteromonas luteoviolacea]|uniref:histidine kinase n=1 Tax=Pseudoalteromonas luteoviolacea H33 TaxID=1365251 RepID=A0A167FYD4_9GAMM|nr:two-component sensor histidine kinase BarA [Pseudoalteromonas luteoviolacea]KZN53363.1 histidine kinase [Pseudoalteromonas luteoviolacea H33]KZN76714.1 histidine kinase [Pseudoalteromonas luteoviolacea H33-S]MBQ4878867.1 two-component sensor histidine kinase BarA [Pseudoalteromonas luteoviolacea]MBQ4907956.1 two-component sensor histidine kinase BarA [Pseudoalteromonas luteoviolacea]